MLAWSWDRNSVPLSVTNVLCDEMKEHTANILTLRERVITLVFLTPTEVGGRCPLPPEICAQSDPLSSKKRRLRPISTCNV